MSSVAMSGPPSVVSMGDFSESDIDSASSAAPAAEPHPSGAMMLGVTVVVKHPRFYDEEGSLTLAVGSTLFRVHAFVFATLSPYWKDRIQSASFGTESPYGTVYYADNFNRSEMESFLSVVYPSVFDGPEVNGVAAWTGVLRVATLWRFDAVKRAAIQQLDAYVSPLQRLELGQIHNIVPWIERAFVELIRQQELPSGEELEDINLTLHDLLHIARAREAVTKGFLSDDEESLLRHVHEEILVVSSTSAAGPPSSTAVPPSITGPAPGPPIASSTLVEGSVSPATPDTNAKSAAGNLNQVRAAETPTARTSRPDPVPSMDVYRSYPTSELPNVLNALRSDNLYLAFESLPLGSIAAFCAILVRCQDYPSVRPQSIIPALFIRTAREPRFNEAGVQIIRFLGTIWRSDEHQYQQEIDGHVKLVQGLFAHLDQLDPADVTIDKIMKAYTSNSGDVNVVWTMLGAKEVLDFYPDMLRERVANLRALVASLTEAHVID
ncbi:unnamed protein product [Peniophora sp. CBMAI 1063]|nr:unnamed protein product [Peniophora sp. CBMAI 1063]